MYETLINQIKHKVDKTIDLEYPKGSGEIIAKDIKVTLKMVKSWEGRRDYWIGGRK